MKKREWNEGLNHIDSDLVEKYIEQKEKLAKKKQQYNMWMRYVAIAACLVLLIGVIVFVVVLQAEKPTDPSIEHITTDKTDTDETTVLTDESSLNTETATQPNDTDTSVDGDIIPNAPIQTEKDDQSESEQDFAGKVTEGLLDTESIPIIEIPATEIPMTDNTQGATDNISEVEKDTLVEIPETEVVFSEETSETVSDSVTETEDTIEVKDTQSDTFTQTETELVIFNEELEKLVGDKLYLAKDIFYILNNADIAPKELYLEDRYLAVVAELFFAADGAVIDADIELTFNEWMTFTHMGADGEIVFINVYDNGIAEIDGDFYFIDTKYTDKIMNTVKSKCTTDANLYWDNKEKVWKPLSESETESETDGRATESDTEPDTETETDLEKEKFSFEKYIGLWYDYYIPPNELEIIDIGDGKIKAYLGIYRYTTFTLIITETENAFTFVDANNHISGNIDFKENSIVVTVEEANVQNLYSGATWTFSEKVDTSKLEGIDNGVLSNVSVDTMYVPENINALASGNISTENTTTNVKASVFLYELDGGVVNWTTENDLLYVITSGSNRLLVIDSNSKAPIYNVPLEGSPAEMNIIEDKIYISFPYLHRIDVFSKATGEKESSMNFDYEVSSFCLDGDYIYYSEHDQHCMVFKHNLITNEIISVQSGGVNTLFYYPKLYLNKEDKILCIGESGSSGSAIYYFDSETLVLKSVFEKNDYGIKNHTREIFHVGDYIFWGGYRISDTDATELIGHYGTESYGSMGFVSEEIVSTYKGLYLTDTYECVVNYTDSGFSYINVIVTDSNNVFFRGRGEAEFIITVDFDKQ